MAKTNHNIKNCGFELKIENSLNSQTSNPQYIEIGNKPWQRKQQKEQEMQI